VSASQPIAAPRDLLTAWGDWGPTSSTWAGANVTVPSSLQLLTVYGCVAFIADGISTLPVQHLRDRADGSAEVGTRAPWLEQPTPYLDFIGWTTQVLTSLLLSGNAYCYKEFSGSRLTGLHPFDPTKVEPKRERGRLSWVVDGREVSNFEMLHIPGVMFPGSDVGLSPVEAARQTIGTGMSAEEYGAKFFGEGSVPDGVIEVPGDMDPAELRQMAQGWAKAHSGTKNRNLPGVLKGDAKWKPTAVTNEQAQFLQTRKFTEVQIAAQMFRIDPTEMGLAVEGQSLTYSNAEERAIRKVQVTFLPWIVRVERALSNLLPRPQYVKFNTSALLRGDTLARFGAYQLGLTNGFMTINEVRDLEDWKPLPGGDVATPRTTPAPQEAP
jgi:HK97 family phage portal protein